MLAGHDFGSDGESAAFHPILRLNHRAPWRNALVYTPARLSAGQPVLWPASGEGAMDAVRGGGQERRGTLGLGVVRGPAVPLSVIAARQP